jgi:hypothetical protein
MPEMKAAFLIAIYLGLARTTLMSSSGRGRVVSDQAIRQSTRLVLPTQLPTHFPILPDQESKQSLGLTFQDPQGDVYSGRATSFVSSSQLSATFNNGNDPEAWTVFVTNPDTQTSNTVTFTVP